MKSPADAAGPSPGGRAGAHAGTVKAFLTAEWRDLAMLNFDIAPDVLRPLVPAGTELDAWRGATCVSIVGFRFVSTRVLGVALPRHVDFEEVNLRFYVRRRAADGWRRGVVFIRELVPRRLIAWVARLAYNEPYRALPMRHVIDRRVDGTPARLGYEWRRSGTWELLRLHAVGEAALPEPGSEAEFITEHYWGYTRQRDGGTVEYRVEHRPWRVWDATEAELACDPVALYGERFGEALRERPRSAFVADGSHVTVFRPARVPGGTDNGDRT